LVVVVVVLPEHYKYTIPKGEVKPVFQMFRMFWLSRSLVRVFPAITTGSLVLVSTLTDITDMTNATIGVFGSLAHTGKFDTVATNNTPAAIGAIPTFVKIVLTASAVTKVRKGIIGGTIRTMSNFLALRARPNPCFRYKPMDVYTFFDPFFA
jgi:hypothetical protein